ncbi:MAG TPA: SIMPL domain-containing protein [Anaerolineales bacterium]
MARSLVQGKLVLRLGVVLCALLVAGCGLLSQARPAAEAEPTGESISVSGFGEATGTPDIATVQLGVSVTADTIGAAIEQSNQTVERVRQAVLGQGIAETDLQSINFNVWPEDKFDPATGQQTGERVYHVDSTLQVKVRDIGQVSEVIQTGLDAGANNIWGLTYGIDDSAALEAEARTKALQDAADRAQQLANALGVSLGDPIAVSELVGGLSPFFGAEAAFARGMGGGGGPPLSPGELTVQIQVDVMYGVAAGEG